MSGQFLLEAGNVVLSSTGVLKVQGGESFTVWNGGTLINAGTITLASGGKLNIEGGAFANTGQLVGTGGTVTLSGSVSVAELTSFVGSGASIVLEGVLNNTNGTLAVGPGTPDGVITLRYGGVIEQGVVRDSGGGLIEAGGTLDDVTYVGSLTVGGGLVVENGLTLVNGGGNGVVDVLSSGGLSFWGSQTLDNAVMQLAGMVSCPSALTLGAHGTLQLAVPATPWQEPYISGPLVNNGMINASVAGGRLQTSGLSNAGTLSVSNGDIVTVLTLINSGSVSLAGGAVLTVASGLTNTGRFSETNATLNLNGPLDLRSLNAITRSGGIIDIGGQLNLAGGTLSLGGTTALGQLRDTGIISGGTIHDAGSGMVFIGGSGHGGTLAADTYQGTINLVPARSTLAVTGGLTVTGATGTGSGAINLLGAGSLLTFQNSQTLDNTTINIGSNVQAATLSVTGPAGTGAVLTLGSHATITQLGAKAEIDVDRGFGGGLVNNGVINATLAGATMTVIGGSFTNKGRVNVGNGATLSLQADQLGNLSGSGLFSGGTWNVLAGSVLDLGFDNPIVNLNATVDLDGSGSQIEYFDSANLVETTLGQTLRYIGSAGQLTLANGQTFVDSGTIGDFGRITLTGGALQLGTISPTAMAIKTGGVVQGAGTVTASAIYNSGTLLAQGGELVVNGAIPLVAPAGLTEIAAGATLEVNGMLGASLQFLGGTGELILSQASGMTGTISGFTGKDVIDLAGVASGSLVYTSTGASNGILTVTSGGKTAATLHLAGAYTQASFKAVQAGTGGTLITIPTTMTAADLRGSGSSASGGVAATGAPAGVAYTMLARLDTGLSSTVIAHPVT